VAFADELARFNLLDLLARTFCDLKRKTISSV
jgi:hypothetical protein